MWMLIVAHLVVFHRQSLALTHLQNTICVKLDVQSLCLLLYSIFSEVYSPEYHLPESTANLVPVNFHLPHNHFGSHTYYYPC